MSRLVGDISLVVNVIALLMLTVGVFGRKSSETRLTQHGYLSVLAFALKLATVLAVMVPPFFGEAQKEMQEFTLLQSSVFGIKLILGIAGTVMGFICIVPWLAKRRDENSCLKLRRWMMPTFIVWALAVIAGAAVHLGDIM